MNDDRLRAALETIISYQKLETALRDENARLKTALAGRTCFHSDAAVEKEMAGLEVREAKLQSLYHTVNMMMARLGAEGEIMATADEVTDVMDALYALDGGVYNQEGI